MSDATKAMRDFLTKSPSVVFPDEVLELFIPVERENEILRMDFELYRELYHMAYNPSHYMQVKTENERLCELIKKVWKWEKNGCYECPLENNCKVLCVYDGDCGMAVEIEKELQELGIEVGE